MDWSPALDYMGVISANRQRRRGVKMVCYKPENEVEDDESHGRGHMMILGHGSPASDSGNWLHAGLEKGINGLCMSLQSGV